MALINCPECKHAISDKATACPQCGYPMTENIANEAPSLKQVFQQVKQKNEDETQLLCPVCLSKHITLNSNPLTNDSITLNNHHIGATGVSTIFLSCLSCRNLFYKPLIMTRKEKQELDTLCLEAMQRTGSVKRTLTALRKLQPKLPKKAKYEYIKNIAQESGMNTAAITRESRIKAILALLGFFAVMALMTWVAITF